MDSFRRFTVVDIAFFEFYLFTMGVLIAHLFPVVLMLHVGYYIAVVVIGLIVIVPAVFKRNPQHWSGYVRNFTNLSVWKIGVYKILVVTCGLLLVTLFPALMMVDIAWYVAPAFFAMGYVVSALCRK